LKRHDFWNIFLTIVITFCSGAGIATLVDEDLRKLVTNALVEKLGVSQKDISILSSKKIDWPNSALGCPQKGQYYLPVITSGYQLKVAVNSREYFVHTGANSAIICENQRITGQTSNSKFPGKESSKQVKAIQLARKLLLTNNAATSARISLVSVEQRAWSEVEKDCSSKSVFKKNSNGYLVTLKREGKNTLYFSNGIHVLECKLSK